MLLYLYTYDIWVWGMELSNPAPIDWANRIDYELKKDRENPAKKNERGWKREKPVASGTIL